jgi:hypothetical protein
MRRALTRLRAHLFDRRWLWRCRLCGGTIPEEQGMYQLYCSYGCDRGRLDLVRVPRH